MQEYQSPAQDAKAWQSGEDAPPSLVTPQPGKAWGGAALPKAEKKQDTAPTAFERAKSQTAASTSAVVDSRPAETKTQQELTEVPLQTLPNTASIPDAAPTRQMSGLDISGDSNAASSVAAPARAAGPSASSPKSETSNTAPQAPSGQTKAPAAGPQKSGSTASVPTPSAKKTSDVHWSRAFLAGKTHLKPEYEDVHNINSTTSASVQLLKANTKYFFYPLAGPGGRLAYHAISAKGRLPVQTPCIGSGHDIVDFALDPFKDERVFIAGSDGKVRVFEVAEGKGDESTSAVITLEGKIC